MGKTALRFIEYLRDPSLVVKFQNMCGARLEVLKEDNIYSDDVHKGTVRTRIEDTPCTSPAVSPGDSPTDKNTGFPWPGTVVRTVTFIDVYFRMATELGYEMFYILVLPLIHFNFDSVIFRQMIILWSMSMYIGQALKSLIRWKRPPSPPVYKLENNPVLEQEYGFPSTHVVVSTVLPFYFTFVSQKRYEFSLVVGLLICFIWSLSVSMSRIYLGVHSFMDILGGYAVSAVMLILSMFYLEALDQYLLHSSYAPMLAFSTVIFLLSIYPVDSNRWTMDRGDTAAILGSGLGMVLGANYLGEVMDDETVLPIPLHWPSLSDVWLAAVRYVCGTFLLIPTRFVMKLLCFRLLPYVMPTGGVEEVGKRPWVELPYKVITYSAMGFNCYYTSTLFFKLLEINRY